MFCMSQNTPCPECKSENTESTIIHKSKIDLETGRRWGEAWVDFVCLDCGHISYDRIY